MRRNVSPMVLSCCDFGKLCLQVPSFMITRHDTASSEKKYEHCKIENETRLVENTTHLLDLKCLYTPHINQHHDWTT